MIIISPQLAEERRLFDTMSMFASKGIHCLVQLPNWASAMMMTKPRIDRSERFLGVDAMKPKFCCHLTNERFVCSKVSENLKNKT